MAVQCYLHLIEYYLNHEMVCTNENKTSKNSNDQGCPGLIQVTASTLGHHTWIDKKNR